MEVWVLNTLLGLPSLTLCVGQNSCYEGRTIVSSEAHKHDSELRDLGLGLDLVAELVDDLLVGFFVPHGDLLLVGVDEVILGLFHCNLIRIRLGLQSFLN